MRKERNAETVKDETKRREGGRGGEKQKEKEKEREG